MRDERPGWHGAALLALLVLGTIWVADDGRHYWHDIRFLFVGSQFALETALSGSFNPHQAWGPVDELSSAGFYAAKMLHIGMLNLLYGVAPPAAGGLEASVWLSMAMVLGTVLAGQALFRGLLGSRRLAWLAAAAMLMAPVTPYLAGKQLSEVPSLFLSVLGLVFLARAFEARRPAGPAWALAAGLAFALAAAARLDSLVGPVGFAVAAMLTAEGRGARAAILRGAGVAFAATAIAYLGALAAVGVGPGSLAAYLVSFVTAGARSPLMSLLSVAVFGGGVYLLALLGGLTARGEGARRAVFFVVWLSLAWAPMILITTRYWIEPRYLVQGLVPLCGLAALGLERVWLALPRPRLRLAVLGAATLALLGLNALAVALMPYELDRRAILGAVAEIARREPEAAILVPWSYTDYNFLRVVAPEARVYNVNAPQELPPDRDLTRSWQSRYRGWYAERYLAEPARLRALLGERPVYYLGWTYYPPLQNALRWAGRLGWSGGPEALEALGLMNHLDQSWLRRAPGIEFEPAGGLGQYEYWRVTAAPGDEPASGREEQ